MRAVAPRRRDDSLVSNRFVVEGVTAREVTGQEERIRVLCHVFCLFMMRGGLHGVVAVGTQSLAEVCDCDCTIEFSSLFSGGGCGGTYVPSFLLGRWEEGVVLYALCLSYSIRATQRRFPTTRYDMEFRSAGRRIAAEIPHVARDPKTVHSTADKKRGGLKCLYLH